MTRHATIVLGGIATLFSAQFARAQALAEQVPGDAVIYVGWAGAEAAKATYQDTHFKALLDESRVRDVFGTYLDQLQAQVIKREPNAAEPFRLLRLLGAPVWKYPTALYVGKPDLTDAKAPHFTVAILTQAGDQAEVIAQDIRKLLPRARRNEPTLSVRAANGVVTFAISSEGDVTLDASHGALAGSKNFTDALKQVHGGALITKYVDVQTIIGVAESGVGANAKEYAAKATAFLDASGLRGLKQVVATAGFEGKDWTEECFLATDAPRAGLLKAMPAGAVDMTLLKGVPADAAVVKTLRFDPAVFTSELRQTLTKTDEEALKYYNYGFGALQQALGTNVEQSVLEPLGTDWVVYGAPEIGSGGILGLVAVNKLDDPVAMKKGLTTVSINLVNWVNIAISKGAQGAPVSLHGARIKIGNADISYLATPIVAPSWAIDNGKLYLGLYPQTVGAAIRQANAGKPSILENEKYLTALKTLKQDKLDSVGYFDLPTAARHGSMYTTLLILGRYIGVADLFGPTLPEPLLPPNDVLLEHLAPAAEGSWTDSAGTHYRSVTSFPGAMLLSEQTAAMSIGAGGSAMMASVLLPSLHRAREVSMRVQSASNLKQIGMGVIMHANDNQGKFPDSLAPLITGQIVPVEAFDNPRNGEMGIPNDIRNDPEAVTQFVTEHSDYIYVGAGKTERNANAETILAYENPEGMDDGINILFCDGHVEFYMMESALQLIAEQQQKPGV